MSIKGTLKEFDDNGKTTKRVRVDVYFSSSMNPPTISVDLPDKSPCRHIEVSINAYSLWTMMFKRMMEDVFGRKEPT